MKNKVISFSIFGDDPKYTVGAIENAKQRDEFYPGWVCRFYVDDKVSEKILNELKDIHDVEIIHKGECTGEGKARTGLFWRYEVLKDIDIDIAIVRDTDSRFSERESQCVKEWLDSDKAFHIIRDHEHHGSRIMGGMWGVKKNNLIYGYDYLLRRYKKATIQIKNQDFLVKEIYPLIKHDVFIHDDRHFFANEHVHSITLDKLDNHFIGEIIEI